MSYLLVLHGHPPIIIHKEDRKEYYAGLEAWDTRQDLTPLREFLKWQTEKTWEKQIVRAERQQGKMLARVFYLFNLCLVLLPHQLVKGESSSRW